MATNTPNLKEMRVNLLKERRDRFGDTTKEDYQAAILPAFERLKKCAHRYISSELFNKDDLDSFCSNCISFYTRKEGKWEALDRISRDELMNDAKGELYFSPWGDYIFSFKQFERNKVDRLWDIVEQYFPSTDDLALTIQCYLYLHDNLKGDHRSMLAGYVSTLAPIGHLRE